MRIVFMGSADFGIPALKGLLGSHEVVGVVSTPSRPSGRGLKERESPVTLFAREQNVYPIMTPENLKEPTFCAELAGLHADLFVVVAFRVLPKSVFSIPPLGTVNIHASLLPKYRGPAPIHRAIEAGETETGVTIFRIDEGIDTGAILFQRKITIGDQETTPELYARLSTLGADALLETIEKMEKGEILPLVQNPEQISRAPKLSKEEALLNWESTAREIFNKIRAFKPFPGSCTIFNGKRLGIEWAIPLEENKQGKPGMVIEVSEDYFDVQCGSGIVRVLQVKPEGRKSMSVHDFLLGTKFQKGTVL